MEVTVRPVGGEADLAAFVDLPWQVYRGSRWWVPPLRREVREMLDVARNPFWEHAERGLFLARAGGLPVGRIAAIIDRNHDRVHGERAGFFGFFECLPQFEAAAALFEAARAWCRERGATFLRGPASPSSNDEYGFLLEGFSSPPVVMMPYNPPYYLDFAARAGFAKVKDLYAFLKCSQSGIPDRIERMMRRLERRSRFTLRGFDPRHFDRDAGIIKTIYNAAWEKNWGFVPLTDREMDYAARKLRDFYDPEMIVIAELDGRPAGIMLTVPNANEVLRHLGGRLGPAGLAKFLWYRRRARGCRTLIGGCLAEYRQSGLITQLFYETVRRGIARYQWCEVGWHLEDNDLINRFAVEIGAQLYKKYRLVQAPL
ncbi:MAG TPA: hypothetical protein VN317_02570 [Candidatus Methanoperedens sp.]|nr:hypothetical protein [Candidatus Methanoperedens sp.]